MYTAFEPAGSKNCFAEQKTYGLTKLKKMTMLTFSTRVYNVFVLKIFLSGLEIKRGVQGISDFLHIY